MTDADPPETPAKKHLSPVLLGVVAVGLALLSCCVFGLIVGRDKDAPDWQDFNSATGFAILFPGKPSIETHDVKGPDVFRTGEHWTAYSARLQRTYGVSRFDTGVKTREPDALLDELVATVDESYAGKRVVTRPVPKAAYPAREVEVVAEVQGRKERFVVRLLLVSSVLYQLVVEKPEGAEALAEDERFLDSFRITKPQ